MRLPRVFARVFALALLVVAGCGNGVLRGSPWTPGDGHVLPKDGGVGDAASRRLETSISTDHSLVDSAVPEGFDGTSFRDDSKDIRDASGRTDSDPTTDSGLSADSRPSVDASPRVDSGPPATPLNVLLVTADDLGLQLSAYGDTAIETPNIDKLAASGVQFKVAYVAEPSCSSSRSAMLTGLYPHSNGQYGLTNRTEFGLHVHLHDAVMPNILKRAGYHTGIVGKEVHVRPEETFAFDERGTPNGRDVRALARFADQFMTNAAGAGKPFFLLVNYYDPHAEPTRDPVTGERGPYIFLDRVNGIPAQLVQPGTRTLLPFHKVDSPQQRSRVASFYNEVKRVDVGVGLLLDTLRRHGHADDTLIIFVGDNGPPFDRAKMTVYEAGLRTPFLVRWPGVSKAMKSAAMVSTVDILPTVIDATAAKPAVKMHGRSLRPVLSAPNAPSRQYLVGEFHMHAGPFFPRRAIRDTRYKLIHNLVADKGKPRLTVPGNLSYKISRESRYDGTDVRRAFDTWADPPEWEFYDLRTDPWEFNNVAGKPEYRAAQERLKQALLEWRKATDDPFLDPAYWDRLHK